MSRVVGVGPAGDTAGTGNIVGELIRQVREAAAAGVTSVWFHQLLGVEAITMAALAGREVPGVEVGTAVVPLYPRHPLALAAAAQTAQAATNGRFTLGVGLGVQALLEPAYGKKYPPPILHLRECLAVLRQSLNGGPVSFEGRTVSAHPPLPTAVPGGNGISLVVAAMGPQALKVAGELADGTVPFLAGPRALAGQIVPAVVKSAKAAGRPEPRIIAAVPAVVTNDADTVRQIAAVELSIYSGLGSYQRILAAGGVSNPAELALIGDEETVAAGIRGYFDAGATEVIIVGAGMRSARERLRTWQLAGQLSQG